MKYLAKISWADCLVTDVFLRHASIALGSGMIDVEIDVAEIATCKIKEIIKTDLNKLAIDLI